VELRKKLNLPLIGQPEEGARSVLAFVAKEPRFKGVEDVPDYGCSSRAEQRTVDNLLRFLVVSSFVVLREVPDHSFLTVPVGSIIESDHEPFLFGLLNVRLGGQEFWAFTRDLHECCTNEPGTDPSNLPEKMDSGADLTNPLVEPAFRP